MDVGQERTDVIRVLEEAGERYLASVDPENHCVFLLQVGGARLYGVEADQPFWNGIQAILDSFFSGPERASICSRLLAQGDLARRQECRTFVAHALAEQRLQVMMASAPLVRPSVAR
jgi:hypothetical protein